MAMMTPEGVFEHRDRRLIAGETMTTIGVNLPRVEGAAIDLAKVVVMIPGTILIPGTNPVSSLKSGEETLMKTLIMMAIGGLLLVADLREGRATILLTMTMVSTMTGVPLANVRGETNAVVVAVAVAVAEEAEVEVVEAAEGGETSNKKVVVVAEEAGVEVTREKVTIHRQPRVPSI